MKDETYTLAGHDLNIKQVSVLMTGDLGYSVIGKRQTVSALYGRGLVDGYRLLTPLGRQAVKEWKER